MHFNFCFLRLKSLKFLSFSHYTYIDPKTGKLIKQGKYSLILKSEGPKRHIFVIPLKNNKSMIVKDETEPRDIKIYSKEKNKAINI